MSESETMLTASGELLLDPFIYQPGKASAIKGLGGAEPHQDPAYAFHTDYVHAAEGPRGFTVRFQGLTARTGTLQLRVHMLIEDDNGRLMLGNSLRTQFNRLIQLGSEISIRFDGYRRVRYALYGTILGETDARADTLTVTLDRPATGEAADAATTAAAELRNTEFGQGTTRAVPLMVSAAEPTLAGPVCQVATLSQTRERAYAEWCAAIGRDAAPARAGWDCAFILQALRTYGVMQPGASGLGFGSGAEAIAGALRARDMAATVADLPDDIDALPGSLVNFDFVWSADAANHAGAAETFAVVEAMMRCLRPGGLAVHVVPFLPGLDQREGIEGETALRRRDVERIALMMISRKAETAQVKVLCDDPLTEPDPADHRPVGAFGMIFRKPQLADG